MSLQEIIATAKTLVANDKGLLAMDESNPTCNKRFAKMDPLHEQTQTNTLP
jgi:fructose-bisphosphate aldolase, class I